MSINTKSIENLQDTLIAAAVRQTLDSYFSMFKDRGFTNERLDHRTGCSVILHAIVRELIEEYGWSRREAIDAIVLEAVRTGGEVESRAKREWLAAKAVKS